MNMKLARKTVPTVLNQIKAPEKHIDTILNLFAQEIGDVTYDTEMQIRKYREAIAESRGEDGWFDWMFKGIIETSKKHGEKRSIQYLCGIYRNWLRMGFGTFVDDEVDKVVKVMEKHADIEFSDRGKHIVREAIREYSLVGVMAALLEVDIKRESDLSVIVANQIVEHLKNQRLQEVNQNVKPSVL